ncbi:MAG: SMP-30/gluconolactonase/LRE family protein, partial [Gaiellaceae bacterium]
MKRTLALLSALAAVLVVAGAGASPRPSAYVLPGAAVFPEGVDFWPKTGQYFVSSTGDGSIMRGHVAEPAASTFVAPTGIGFSSIGVKVDKKDGLLYVAGGNTGTVRVYDAETAALLRTFESGPGGFINDLVVTRGGDVYATDSFRPILWRAQAGSPGGALEPWLPLAATPIQYTPGFNLNGIVATKDGDQLVVAQSSTGKLFHVDVASKTVSEIDLGGELVPADGLEL